MEIIKDLIEQYGLSAESFKKAKQDYYASCFPSTNKTYSKEKAHAAFTNLYTSFNYLMQGFAHKAKIKEDIGIYNNKEKMVTPFSILQTRDSGIEISFVLFREFSLNTRIMAPGNIKFMPDEFWSMLFELNTLGDFSFYEEEKPTREMRDASPQLFNKRGNYFKLLRNYFLFEAEYGRISTLGNISVKWDNDITFNQLVKSASRVFEIMYKLNLMLWKQENK